MDRKKILIVDDEQGILDLVTAYLNKEGYQVYTALDGPSGLKAAKVYKPDLVILDILLPGMDGIELLNRIRRESDVYIILLTAKADEMDRVVGLSVGADDYVTKPFSPRELVARIKAAFRRLNQRSDPRQEDVLGFRHIRIDPSTRQVWLDGDLLELTAMEFDILYRLAEQRGRVLSREQLLETVWGHDYFGEIRVVDVHIGHIREKMGGDLYIATVRGVGYRFIDDVE